MKFLILVIFVLPLFAQEDDKIIGRIGNTVITADEFHERYELTPKFRKQIKNYSPILKLDFFYTLAAEKLWALEAIERNFDKTEAMILSTEMFEKMFTRDLLYRMEIKDKIQLSDQEILQGYFKSSVKFYINFLFSEDEEEIFNLYELLNTGFPFDTILAASIEFEEQPAPIEVVFGQMEETIEDSLFNMKIGQHTAPILMPEGWYIFILKNKVTQLLSPPEEENEIYKRVKKTIQSRKEAKLYREFYKNFFANRKVDVDASLFKSLTFHLSNILSDKKEKFKLREDERVMLESNDVLHLEKLLNDSLYLPFIKFEEEPITLKKYIRILAFNGFNPVNTDYNSIFISIDDRTLKLIEQELTAREGIKRGLNFLPEVKNQVKMWRENYLFQSLKSEFLDSAKVSEEELLAEYNRRNVQRDYPLQVKIVELLTDSLELIENVFEMIDNGISFEEIAAKYTQRKETKNKGGVFDWFPVTIYGEIGSTAAKMEPGEIFGPLKVDEGYSIFKLLDKREAEVEPPQSFERVKSEMIKEISERKLKAAMNNFTIQLANKYGIGLNYSALDAIEVTTVNSVGYRFLGFGGRIVAVPIVAPFNDWVDPWIDGQTINP